MRWKLSSAKWRTCCHSEDSVNTLRINDGPVHWCMYASPNLSMLVPFFNNNFTRWAPITAKFSSVPVPRPVLSYPLVTTCYPRGAPAYACQYLYVKHNYILPQFSPTPYLVEVNNTEYSPGDVLSSECTIEGIFTSSRDFAVTMQNIVHSILYCMPLGHLLVRKIAGCTCTGNVFPPPTSQEIGS